MATIKDVKRTPSGRLTYRGESFSGYNKQKRTPGKNKKFAVLAKNSAGETCTSVSIGRIYWACRGMGVDLEFDASTNVLAIPLPADSTGDEYYDDRFSGIPNNAGSGVTGDIDFTTVGHSSGDAYSIILVLNKNY